MPRYRLLIDEDLKAHLKKLFKKNRSLYDAVLNQKPHPKGWGMLRAALPVFMNSEIV